MSTIHDGVFIPNNKDNKLTYAMIERFVKVSKTHRNIGDQEKGFIQKVILDSISL